MVDVNRIARPCILKRKPYITGKPAEEVQRELGLSDILKLASNENLLGTSPLAMQAMLRELQQNANYYPESLCYDLVHKLAARHGLTPGHYFIDNGEDGVITMLGLTFLNPEDEVVLGELTFPAYENIAAKMGARCAFVPLTADHRLDVNGFIAALTPQTKLVCFCNPNNPTGTINTRAEFEHLLQAVPETALLVSDEAYYDFVTDPQYPETTPYLAQHPNLIILRTFSKIMGLAGVRIGYAIAHPDLIQVMLKAREPFPVNRIAQAGALAALDDLDFIRNSIKLAVEGRQQIAEALNAMGVQCYPSQTNFVCVELGRPAQPVFEAMLRSGVIVRPLGPMGAPTCLRITIGTQAQNERMLAALRDALQNIDS